MREEVTRYDRGDIQPTLVCVQVNSGHISHCPHLSLGEADDTVH